MQKVVELKNMPTSASERDEKDAREEVNGTLRAQMFVRLADEVGNAIRINNSNSTVVTPTNHQQPCLQ